jgi:hypothetical protein
VCARSDNPAGGTRRTPIATRSTGESEWQRPKVEYAWLWVGGEGDVCVSTASRASSEADAVNTIERRRRKETPTCRNQCNQMKWIGLFIFFLTTFKALDWRLHLQPVVARILSCQSRCIGRRLQRWSEASNSDSPVQESPKCFAVVYSLWQQILSCAADSRSPWPMSAQIESRTHPPSGFRGDECNVCCLGAPVAQNNSPVSLGERAALNRERDGASHLFLQVFHGACQHAPKYRFVIRSHACRC